MFLVYCIIIIYDAKIKKTLNANDCPLNFALVESLYQTALYSSSSKFELQVMAATERITFKFGTVHRKLPIHCYPN